MPAALIDVSVFVVVKSLVTKIVLEDSSEDIAVEEGEFSLDFLIVLPVSVKHCSLTEKVSAFPFLFPFGKLAFKYVLVDILKNSFP